MKRKMRKNLILFLSILLFGTLLAACSSKEGSGDSPAAKENSESAADTDSSADSAEENGAEEESAAEAESREPIPLGSFSMEDIDGNLFTENSFADYDLTFVNVFATWCSPCIREIPDLEELHQNMKDKGVNVVGIVLDTADGEGGADPEALETAKLLAEETGATYPFLIPDAGLMNGLLTGVQAVPTSFFVDSDGNLVGNVYTGSRSLEDWTELVNQELEALEAAQ